MANPILTPRWPLRSPGTGCSSPGSISHVAQDVFEALEAESTQLQGMLASLGHAEWDASSRCRGWSVSDVVLHLAQTEEAVTAFITGSDLGIPMQGAANVDEVMSQWVAAERGGSEEQILERWRTAHRTALNALRSADPNQPIAWVAAPLKPRTLATTRLSEHWIHAHDIADPLGVDYADTDRLWHLCWLAHRTLGYAFIAAGHASAPDVYLELESPSGETWSFGEEEAPVKIRGPVGEFCRVAARRLDAEDARGLESTGAGADDVLRLVRTYA